MKAHTWIVNIARGSLIDTEALVQALASGSSAVPRSTSPTRTAPERSPAVGLAERADHAARREPGLGDGARPGQAGNGDVRRFAADEDLLAPWTSSRVLAGVRAVVATARHVQGVSRVHPPRDRRRSRRGRRGRRRVRRGRRGVRRRPRHAADRGDRRAARLNAKFTINSSSSSTGILQRRSCVPDHRRGDLLPVVKPLNVLAARRKAEESTPEPDAPVEDVRALTEILDFS